MESSNPKVNKIKQELKYDVAKRMIDEGYGIVDIMGNRPKSILSNANDPV